jgi:hypothetical protein
MDPVNPPNLNANNNPNRTINPSGSSNNNSNPNPNLNVNPIPDPSANPNDPGMPSLPPNLRSLPRKVTDLSLGSAKVSDSNGGVPVPVNVGGVAQLPPPLEKARFENAYKTWVVTENMKHDSQLMNADGRAIDLHALHMHVMEEGGFSKVQNEELWDVIGGKMGFVQFPASDAREPAKSGPGVAHRLAVVYKEYLLPFDTMYITSVVERWKQMKAAAAAVQAAALASGNAGGARGVGGAGPGPSHGSVNPPNLNANNNPNPTINPSGSSNNNSNPNPNLNVNLIPDPSANPNPGMPSLPPQSAISTTKSY